MKQRQRKSSHFGKVRRDLLRRVTALFLTAALALPLVSCGINVTADVPGAGEEPERYPFALTQLEELPEPVTFPAKGYLGVRVPLGKSTDASGLLSVSYRTSYLPVIVDEKQNVYGKLDSLADLMGLAPEISGSRAVVEAWKTKITLTAGRSVAAYKNAFFNVKIPLDAAPLEFDGNLYVPLETFILMAGGDMAYLGEETPAGTKRLLICPPQETVLDRLADYYPQRYSVYAFDYLKDLGYAPDAQQQMLMSAEVSSYYQNLLALNPHAWWFTLTSYVNNGDTLREEPVQRVADALVGLEESQVSQLFAERSEKLDRNSIMLGALKYNAEFSMKDLSLYKNSLINSEKLGRINDFITLENGVKYMDITGNVVQAAQYLLSYYNMTVAFESANAWMSEACRRFLRQRDLIGDEGQALSDDMYQVFSDRVASYGVNGGLAQIGERQWQWWQENLLKVAADVSALRVGYMGVISLGASIWDHATDWAVEQADAYLTGVEAIRYEHDALAVLDKIYENTFSQIPSSWGAENEEQLRYALSNAVKASYVARYFGNQAATNELKEEPEYASVKEHQDNLNKELAQYLNDFSDRAKPLGLMPPDLTNLGADDTSHYSNVIFTMAELTGIVRDWKDEEPAKNVRMEIRDEDDELLAECETDENGQFDVSFDMGDADSLETDSAAERTLNICMYYKKLLWEYPVSMQLVEIISGRKYQVDGLHVGEKERQLLVSLEGARTTKDGKTLLLARPVTPGDGAFGMDVPDYQGGVSYRAYFCMEFTYGEVTSYELRSGVSFGSVYTAMMPEGGINDLLYNELGLGSELLSDALLNREMDTEEEITAFVDAYKNLNDGISPVLVLTLVNSEVKQAEPSVVNPE